MCTGNAFSLFLLRDGSAWGVGSNAQGQLGTGLTAFSIRLPIPILLGVKIQKMAAGWEHSVFLATNHTVYFTGANTVLENNIQILAWSILRWIDNITALTSFFSVSWKIYRSGRCFFWIATPWDLSCFEGNAKM